MDPKIKNALNDPKVEFAVVPSTRLKELISHNDHPFIKPMPDNYKAAFLMIEDGMGIPVTKDLIFKYIEHKLSDGQRFILDMCDVRIIGMTGPAIVSAISK